MIFKVGDKVKIREDLVEGECKGPLYVNGEMALMSGKTLTIKVIRLARECYTVEENLWDWNDEMLEKLPNLKPVDQVIEELESERTGIIENNKKIGQMINRNVLTIEQNELLAAQKRAYDTVSMILGVRIRSLKNQVPEPAAEPTKYNVQVPGIENSFYYRSAETDSRLQFAGSGANNDDDQQWTLEQIEKYGLKDCPRFEVQDD